MKNKINGVIRVCTNITIKKFRIDSQLFDILRREFFRISIDEAPSGEHIILTQDHKFFLVGVLATLHLWKYDLPKGGIIGDACKILEVLTIYRDHPTIKVLLVDDIDN